MYVVLIGPQGSGKGTQAELLAPKHNLMKIATGDLFRAERASGTSLGQQLGVILDKGDLVPDDITLAIVEDRLRAIDAAEAGGAVFDGFPRTDGQARGLDEALARRGASIDLVIEIEIPESVLIERLSGRRVCPTCGAIYHILSKPPLVAGICDVCGSKLEQRADDSEAAIRRRLALFREMTAPLLRYYGERGIVHQADGDQGMEAVEQAIDNIVASVLAPAE